MRQVQHFINGAHVAGAGKRKGDIYNPNTGEIQAQVDLADASVLQQAIAAAAAAQPEWAAVNPQHRARVMFKLKELVEANANELAELLSSEHGKVIADAHGDIQRGLEVVELACGIPQMSKGKYTNAAGPGIDVYSMRQPLGVTAGITPFNFPAMIPMWMFSLSIAMGNTFILKPSEKDPSVPVRLAELFMEAGGPAGVLNVVHGDKEAVDGLLQAPEVRAISFVGSSDIAHYVYMNGTANGKRMQCMGGAKNHGIIMPDANMDQAVKDIVGAAYGSAGERCMALPVAVTVGDRTGDEFVERMIDAARGLKVGVSTDPEAHYGPVISEVHKNKVEGMIQTGVDEGADLLLDGRGLKLQGNEGGYFIGPSLFDNVKPGMETYHEEIFGPVLQVMRVGTLEEAAALPSQHQYGNGVAIFTQDGRAAREFASQVNVGMVGINVPIPVPVSYHSFGGWKRSAFGDHNQYGMEGIRFWSQVKTVTQRWPGTENIGDQAFIIPTMS